MSANGNNVWKWIAGILASLSVSNFSTAVYFKTDSEDVRKVIASSFTDISDDKGMYAKEGRSRIKALESRVDIFSDTLIIIKEDLVEIKTLIRNQDRNQ